MCPVPAKVKGRVALLGSGGGVDLYRPCTHDWPAGNLLGGDTYILVGGCGTWDDEMVVLPITSIYRGYI